ncbi:MAG: hypothetical protein H7Y89_13340 [Steroidobacteraceae bacterium]|nr:hypothetical protein [Steroidobacteraceae bacterium]
MRNVFASMALITLAACGGGGGSGSSAPAASTSQPAAAPATSNNSPAAVASSTATADLGLADRLYRGDSRTPNGFDVEARPSNVYGTLSTRHLKNTDFATGPQAAGPTFEVCSNDMAQALAWSETQSTWNGMYSDLVEVRGDSRMFEVIRVPRFDVTAMLRHRVFRCDYLDRSSSDLRADVGNAGSFNQRPLNADEFEKLGEYLWQFTMYNNSNFVVASSSTATSAGSLVHTIRMAQLVRGAVGSCDTVQVMDWTHTMNTTSGAISRELMNVRSFQAQTTSGSTSICS